MTLPEGFTDVTSSHVFPPGEVVVGVQGPKGDQGTTPPINTDGTLAANSDTEVPSQKATKTYVDAETTARAAAVTAEAGARSAGDAATLAAAEAYANSGSLTAVSVKTANYAAAPGEFVPVDTTTGAKTITLPTAPTDGTRVAVKHVIQGGTNTVTINCGGSDVFNKTGGATSATLSLLAQGMILHYQASTHIWYVEADDLALAQLDLRYPIATLDTDGTLAANSDAKVPSEKAVRTYVAANPGLTPLGSVVNVGEGKAVAGPRTITAVTATKIEFPIFVAPQPAIVTGLKIITPSAQALDSVNYWIPMLRRRRMSLPVNTYANEVLLDLPYAYWRFNEASGTVAADGGSGNHPLTYSTPGPTLQQPSLPRRGANASALWVKSSSEDAVAAAYAWDFSSQQFTIEFFLRMNSFGTPSVRQTVFGRPVTAGQPNIEIGGSNATSDILQGKVVALQPGNFLYETASFTVIPGTDEIHHVVYRKNGSGAGTQAFFIDGVKQIYDANEIATTDFTNASAETHVGSREHAGGSPAGQFFDGGIDEVAVYNTALSDARIQKHAAVGAPMAEIARKWTNGRTFSEAISAWQPWTFDMVPFDPYASVLDKDDVVTVAFYCQGSPSSLADVVCELTYELI